MLYSIVVRENKEFSFLNHSCMNTLSFGSHDMAWLTNNPETANNMLQRVKQKHAGDNRDYEIMIH